MRVFQKWMLSGSPSAWRGPGRSSRKKSASCSSKDRRPLGTTLMSWGGLVPVVADDRRPPEFLAAFGCDVGAVSALPGDRSTHSFSPRVSRQSRTSSMESWETWTIRESATYPAVSSLC